MIVFIAIVSFILGAACMRSAYRRTMKLALEEYDRWLKRELKEIEDADQREDEES